GSFTAINLPWTSGFNNGCGGQDQMWSATAHNVNVLSGLNAGTYYLELYSDASVTCSGGTVYASNNGANYKATFTVNPDYISLNTIGTSYTEDFNSLSNSSASAVLPMGWRISETGTNANNTYSVSTGSNNGGDSYSFGASASSDRTLGGLFSGSLNPTFGAKILNNTGSTIASLSVSYTGETWRVGAAGRPDRLNFQYSTNATSLSTGTWLDIDSLDYYNIAYSTAPQSGSVIHSANRNFTFTGLSISTGSFVWIRWTDMDATGSDDGMGIDDISIKPCFSVNAPTTSAQAFCGSATVANLTATGSGILWYAGSTGGSNLSSSTSLSSTTYYVSQTVSNCESPRATSSVAVNALPTVSAGSNQTVCAGTSVTLSGSGASTYTWNNNVQNGVAFTPSTTQTYTVTGTGANGCTNTAQVQVAVNAAPIANAGVDIVGANTCGKNSINLAASSIGANESGVWNWVSGTNANVVFNSPSSNNSTLTGTYGSTYTLSWTVTNSVTNCTATDNVVVTFNQPNAASISGLLQQGDLLWAGLNSSDWSDGTNWYLYNVNAGVGSFIQQNAGAQPTTTSQVYSISQSNAGICVASNALNLSATSNAKDLYVSAGIILNLSTHTVNVAQNLTNNGSMLASTGTINFNGSSNGTINGSGNTQLFNVSINKTQGASITLQQPVLVTNNLNMVQGNVFTSNTNLLTLGVSSAAPGSLTYNAGTIVGPFKRYFANAASSGTDGLFPVGTAVYNRYADVAFTAGPGVDQYLTVEYKTGAPLQGGIPLYNGLPLMASGSLIQNYSADGYWSVIPTNNNYTSPITSANYGVTLFANNLTGMQSPQICRIIKSAGSNNVGQHHVAWQACGTHTPINGAANPQAFLITSTATQGFSWFNVGTPNSQALPVELLSFNGDCNEGQVNLSWQTATEHNSDYFEVEKSRDGMNWQALTTVNAAGNSTQLLNYEAVDAHAMEGNNYYRLTQVDIDGTSKTYDVINVSCVGTAKGYFSAYPNPSTGSFQVILNDKNLVGSGILSVKDTKGADLLNRTIEVKPGINMFSINDLNLAPGVYYIQIVNGERATEVLKEVIR
ncbi:MAG: T9SS type A sorting domain-containing protein, partial [Flavobacteriales bacterium]